MTASGLYTAAVFAAGTAPTDPSDYQAWLGRVSVIVSDLGRLVAADTDREARKTGEWYDDDSVVKSFRAHLVGVDVITRGEGDKQITKGVLILEAGGSINVDEAGHETIETPSLSTEVGADEFGRAQALVGQNVVIWKRNFLHRTDKTKKLKELVAVDPAGGNITSTAARPSRTATAAAPPPAVPESPAQQAPTMDPVATAAAAQAAVEQRTQAAPTTAPEPAPSAQPTSSPSPTGGDVQVDSIETLLSAAAQHLGMTADEVHAAVESRFGKVPEGRRLPGRQYANLWKELSGGHAA